MKYTCTVTIPAPLETVVSLWKDEANFKHWQDGFVSIEHLEGVPETEGARSRILFKQGKRTMELMETILVANLPHEKKGLYEHIHMTNTQSSRFEAIDSGTTLYTSEVEYTQFNSFLPRMMARLFPGMFRKQSQKWMDQFKASVENNT